MNLPQQEAMKWMSLKIEDFPEKIAARCLKCGWGWKFWRADGFICPGCATSFEEAHFSGHDKYFVELDGNWEQRGKAQ